MPKTIIERFRIKVVEPLRITTRQGLQLHGVLKSNLKAAIARINQVQLSTLGACGDVNRNVMCCPAPIHSNVYRETQALADRLWRDSTGSANRVARLHVLAEPPAIDKGEITDKGSINQRAVLAHRAALVEALYDGPASDPFLILPDKT